MSDSDTLFGENEAHSRLMKELHQHNTGQIQYPKAMESSSGHGEQYTEGKHSHNKENKHQDED
jgi:hypothetical protein